MHLKKIINKTIQYAAPFILGGAILYWMYCGFDFSSIKSWIINMDWTWMLLSLPFGVLAQVFRGIRWRQLLEPIGEHSRISTAVHAVFLSYASSLVIPRVGEVMRCGILNKYDGVSFPKALGTVVSERIIDSLLVIIIMGVTLLLQMPVFFRFFAETGTDISHIFRKFTVGGYWATGICALAAVIFIGVLIRRLSFFSKVKSIFKNMMEGILSLKKVENLPLFIAYTLAIWLCYFLHFYLTFFCYPFTSHLSALAALVVFVVGSIAVIVPTPNGAGPWHFAVKTMLVFYGVAGTDGAMFALVVHTLQTALVALLGVISAIILPLTNSKKNLNH